MLITMASWLVFALFIISAIHFLIENILAPSARMRLRYSIFEMRDELREECENHEGEELAILQKQMNVALAVMSSCTISGVREARKFFRENPEERAEADRRSQVVETSSSARVAEISKRLQSTMRAVLLVNSAGWFIYLVPIALVVMAIRNCNRIVRRKLRTAIRNVLNLPDRAFPASSDQFLHA